MPGDSRRFCAVLPAEMPDAYGVTEKQAAFVAAVARGSGNFAESARIAGYSEKAFYRVLALPHVRQAIEQELRAVLLTEDAPLARKVLHDLVADKDTAPRIRVDAAKILLDRAGITPPEKAAHGASAERPINDMTTDELMGFVAQRQSEVARLEQELEARANAARRVDNAPNPDAPTVEAAALLD